MLFLKQKVKTVSHDFFLHDNVTKTKEFVKRLKTQSRPSAERNNYRSFLQKGNCEVLRTKLFDATSKLGHCAVLSTVLSTFNSRIDNTELDHNYHQHTHPVFKASCACSCFQL